MKMNLIRYIEKLRHLFFLSYILTTISLCFHLKLISAQQGSRHIGDLVTVMVHTASKLGDTATVPDDTTTILGDIATIQSKTAIILDNTATISSQTAIVQGNTATVPANTATIREDTATIPGDTTMLPGDTATIPGNTATIPRNAATIPGDTATKPGNTATILANTATITANTATIPDIATISGDTATTPSDTATKLGDTVTTISHSRAFKITFQYNSFGSTETTRGYRAPISDAALCSYKWTHSSNICNCNNIGILSVPANVPTNTTHLFLENNSIHSLKDFSFRGLRRLRVLSLSNNPELEYISRNAFEGTYALEELYLSNIGLTKIEDFLSGKGEDLMHLKIVDMSHNKIHTIQKYAFHEMVAIEVLDLSYNNIEALSIYFNFVGLSGLERLNMSHNPSLHEIGGRSLVGMSAIRHLDLSFSNLTQLVDEEFWGLKSLEYLNLSYSPMRLLTNRALSWLSSLKVIDLSNCKIKSIKETFMGLNVRSIDLSYNLLSLIHEDAFMRSPFLISISFRGNRLHAFPIALCKTANIEKLDLSLNLIRKMGVNDVLCIANVGLFNGEENPYTCDKNIVEFAIHMHAPGSRSGWPDKYKCYEPYRWRNKTIKNYVNSQWETLTSTLATVPTTFSPASVNTHDTYTPGGDKNKASDQFGEFGSTNLIITLAVVVLGLLVFVVAASLIFVVRRLRRYTPVDGIHADNETKNVTRDEGVDSLESPETVRMNEILTVAQSRNERTMNTCIGINEGIKVYHKIENKEKRRTTKNKSRNKNQQHKRELRKKSDSKIFKNDSSTESTKPYEHRHKTHVYVVTSPTM